VHVKDKAFAWAAALALLSGCGAEDTPRSDSGAASKAAATSVARKSFDPPQRFGRQGVALPGSAGRGKITLGGHVTQPLAVALHKTTAYIASLDSVQAIDTADGRILATVRPQRAAAQARGLAPVNNSVGPPAIARIDEHTIVVAAFAVTTPGHGTTPSRTGLELIGVDTATNKRAWTLAIALPDWAATSDEVPALTVLGVERATAALTVTVDDRPITYAMELTSRRVAWKADRVAALAVAGDRVIGLASKDRAGVNQQLVGLTLDSGKHSWTALDAYETTILPAGPQLIVAVGRNYSDGRHFTALIRASNGKNVSEVDGRYAGLSCSYDQASIIVCDDSTSERAFALKADSGTLLWQLPKAGRVAPQVSAAWHGAVYGTTENGPVVLDARTGADRNNTPGIAPVLVNEYAGIAVQDDAQTLAAHPATG
jgi:outer membrane protein assembly factor BamB